MLVFWAKLCNFAIYKCDILPYSYDRHCFTLAKIRIISRNTNILKKYFVCFLLTKTQNLFKMLIMNELEVKEIREKMGFSQERFAKILGVTARTIQNWESGGVIPQPKQEMLHEITLNPQSYFGSEQQNVNGNNIAGGNVTVHQTDTDKLLELLSSKEISLTKAQEHIDKLLAIIERLTK